MHITNGGNENPDDRAMMLSEGKRGGLSSRPRNDKRTGAGNDENFRAPSWIKAADGRTYPEGLPVRSRSQSGTLLFALQWSWLGTTARRRGLFSPTWVFRPVAHGSITDRRQMRFES